MVLPDALAITNSHICGNVIADSLISVSTLVILHTCVPYLMIEQLGPFVRVQYCFIGLICFAHILLLTCFFRASISCQ